MFRKCLLWLALIGPILALVGLRAEGQDRFGGARHQGFLGVYVVPGDEGMMITQFIRNTPAYHLYQRNQLHRYDTIVRLAGRDVHTLYQLWDARDSIPPGKEGRMVLLSHRGEYYHVWIHPMHVRGGAAAAPMAPDRWSAPKFGRGEGADVRDAPGEDADEDDADVRDVPPAPGSEIR